MSYQYYRTPSSRKDIHNDVLDWCAAHGTRVRPPRGFINSGTAFADAQVHAAAVQEASDSRGVGTNDAQCPIIIGAWLCRNSSIRVSKYSLLYAHDTLLLASYQVGK